MKRLFLGLLMLIMLTPSLVCAMPMCTNEAFASKTQVPCADHASHHGDKKGPKSGKVMFMSDCMGVGMQLTDTASLDKQHIKKDLAVYSLVADAPVNWSVSIEANVIRGPPPDWPWLPRTQPSILLKTQRLRI